MDRSHKAAATSHDKARHAARHTPRHTRPSKHNIYLHENESSVGHLPVLSLTSPLRQKMQQFCLARNVRTQGTRLLNCRERRVENVNFTGLHFLVISLICSGLADSIENVTYFFCGLLFFTSSSLLCTFICVNLMLTVSILTIDLCSVHIADRYTQY